MDTAARHTTSSATHGDDTTIEQFNVRLLKDAASHRPSYSVRVNGPRLCGSCSYPTAISTTSIRHRQDRSKRSEDASAMASCTSPNAVSAVAMPNDT
jgi:hypothetical protein